MSSTWQIIVGMFTIGWSQLRRTFFIALTKLEMALPAQAWGTQDNQNLANYTADSTEFHVLENHVASFSR